MSFYPFRLCPLDGPYRLRFSDLMLEFMIFQVTTVRCPMRRERTKEGTCQAFSNSAEFEVQTSRTVLGKDPVSEIEISPASKIAARSDEANVLAPTLRVVLMVGNEFQGKMHELIHETDTPSVFLAGQQATKAARKEFRFVIVLSVEPI